jgi:hypothetical protein
MLIRTCGATFGPNGKIRALGRLMIGELVCFFPKQTVLPRIKGSVSRSPSVTRDLQRTPLSQAMSALSRMDNPRKAPMRFRVGE